MAWVRGGVHCLPLALPMLLMIAWRSGQHVTGETADFFNWRAKFAWMTMILRDRWIAFDIGSTALIGLILYKTFRDRNIEYSRNLGLSTLFLIAVFVFLPRIVFGSAYADMRLAPFMVAIALISVRPRPLPGDTARPRAAPSGAERGPAPADARDAAAADDGAVRRARPRLRAGRARPGRRSAMSMFDQRYDRELKALDHVPVGARLITFVGVDNCNRNWTMSRMEHMPALALERRRAYTNDQWSMAGAQLLTTRYAARAGRFAHDPSQIVTDSQCPGERWRPIDRSLAFFPRAAFDYVWLINPPPYHLKYATDLTPVWRDGTSVLYRVNHVDVAPPAKRADFRRPARSTMPVY